MILATNTSALSVARIADLVSRPERVLGMHFFSPVHKMPLLEVITHARTAPDVTATAVAYGKQLGKTVIVVNDGPGFYTTRTLAAYMNEAGFLLDDGASVEALDRAMVEFGFPVGPVTLLDEVGLDVAGKVAGVLTGLRLASHDRIVIADRTGAARILATMPAACQVVPEVRRLRSTIISIMPCSRRNSARWN